MNIPTIDDHKAIVEELYADFERAVNEYQIWYHAWLARQRGYEGYDGDDLQMR